jgi:hypothetical protein
MAASIPSLERFLANIPVFSLEAAHWPAFSAGGCPADWSHLQLFCRRVNVAEGRARPMGGTRWFICGPIQGIAEP